MIHLEVLNGECQGKIIETPLPSISIGRAPTNLLIIPEPNISARHSIIRLEGDKFIYKDLTSTNGSIIQRIDNMIKLGDKCNEIVLENNDLILLGGDNPIKIICKIHEEIEKTNFIALKPIKDIDKVTDKLQRDPLNFATLYKVQQKFSFELNLSQVMDHIAEAVFELLQKATHITIVLSDEEEHRYEPVLVRGRNKTLNDTPQNLFSRTVFKKVIKERASVLVANAIEEVGSTESIMGANILSTMGVPLWKGEDIIGVLQVDNRTHPGIFKEVDLELLTVLAGHASLVVDNAILYQKLKIAEESLRKENIYLKGREERRQFKGIIGQCRTMQDLYKQLEKVVDTRVTVLIEGETGTGKELIASAVHYQSKRKNKLFVAQNCAALPENLLESELFGYKKGAFTGADHDKKGLFEIADEGTLFLDEVGEIPLGLQGKLLRVLQEGEIRPLGSGRSISVDVRIVAATNRDLEEEIKQGHFREDLYYRLKVFPIRVPSLRERKEDIPLLIQYFLDKYTKEYGKNITGISETAMRLLITYKWPGNVRELENEIQRLVIQSDSGDIILPQHLSPKVCQSGDYIEKIKPSKGTLKEMMEEVEQWLIIEALKEHNGNKSATAITLGITREGLHKKLAKYGI